MEVDQYGDSFGRDTTVEELRECMSKMKDVSDGGQVDERLMDLVSDSPGWMFKGTVMCFVDLRSKSNGAAVGSVSETFSQLEQARTIARFASARLAEDVEESTVTHVVVDAEDRDDQALRQPRSTIAQKKRLPRIVTLKWIEESWAEKTRLDEERFAPV